MCTNTHAHARTCTHTHTHTHARAHTHTHTHTHTRARARSLSLSLTHTHASTPAFLTAAPQEINRKKEIEELCEKGIVPLSFDLKKSSESGKDLDLASVYPLLMGQAASAVRQVKTARQIVDEMVDEARAVVLRSAAALTTSRL
jgi:hypothetical protein